MGNMALLDFARRAEQLFYQSSIGQHRNWLVDEFDRIRSVANRQQAWALLTKRPDRLQSFADIINCYGLRTRNERGISEIPIHAIVGSVNRVEDFTANFLPKHKSSQERWVSIKQRMLRMEPLPPIDVYRVGAFYFVLDGHHRVSVARQMGLVSIEAQVVDVTTMRPMPCLPHQPLTGSWRELIPGLLAWAKAKWEQWVYRQPRSGACIGAVNCQGGL